jgi:hypothetical protein
MLKLFVLTTVKPEITHTLSECKLLWVIRGYGFFHVYLHMFYRNWWIQSYGLLMLKVMGYHSMGYLRFDCKLFYYTVYAITIYIPDNLPLF